MTSDLLRRVLRAPTPPAAGGLHVNYRYLLAWAGALPGACILDFGCGDGVLVNAGRAAGLDVHGADAFYGGSEARRDVAAAGLLGDAIREIRDGRLPFEDGRFDLVLSNQVFEHVDPLEPTLDEVSRVLKPGGLLVCLFPTLEVVREAHCGVPFLHRLPRGFGGRTVWASLWHGPGFSHGKGSKSRARWAADAVDWMDRYVHYRRRSDALRAISRRFDPASIEEHYLEYRLRERGRWGCLAPLLGIPWARAWGRAVCRRLNGVVLAGRKRV